MTTKVTTTQLNDRSEARLGESLTTLALRRLRRDPLTLVAISVLLVLAALSILAPLITARLGVSATSTDVQNAFLPIGAPGHLLGTDDLGRDHLARLLYAGQVSLSIGFMGAMIAIVIGVSLGMITGYYGGLIDDIVNWIIATLASIPDLFLLLIVSAVFSPGPFTLILIFGFLSWSGTTRLVRGEALSLREREFIIGARAVGATPLQIMFTHILPNLFSVIIVTLALDIGGLILGFAVPAAYAENMLTNAQTFFTKGVHLVILPGLLIFITVLCLFVIGDGIRDAFDPTIKD